MSSKPPTLMPHTERQALINQPLAALGVHVHGTSYPWSGVHIEDTVPTEGRRVWKVTPEDEELVVRHHKEKE